MVTRERTCRSGDVRDLRLGHQVATVAHLDFRRASKSGHEIRLPKRCEEDVVGTGKINLLEEVDSEARRWLEPALALLRKKEWTEQHRNVARNLVLEGGWVQSAKHVTKRNAQKGTPPVPSMERGPT